MLLKKKPRWYQTEAYEATLDYIQQFKQSHPLIVCPTGAGKSLIISMLAAYLIDNGCRVLVLSHVEEIITQDANELVAALGKNIVGVYSAALKRKERKRVTVAAVQSIHRKASLFSNYEYIIVDEAHTIPHKSEGMYHRVFEELSSSVVIGLTATPFRMSKGYLTEGEEKLFDDIVYNVPVERLIAEGFLSPLLTSATKNELDVAGVKTVAGDFSQKDMSVKLGKYELTEKVVDEMMQYRDQYKSWLLFAIDIEHCKLIHQLLVARGMSASLIHSKQKRDPYGNTRPETVDLFQNGHFQALVSVASLTTGFDHPGIDLIGLVRPTKSPVLHVQMIGRGLRISEGKTHCRVLDFAGNIMRLGPINDVHVHIAGKSKKTPREAPVKICPQCSIHLHASARICYNCQYEFPQAVPELTTKPTKLKVVLEEVEREKGWFAVSDVFYAVYQSKAGAKSMRVTYVINGKKVHEYINPFGDSKRNRLHGKWWTLRARDEAHTNKLYTIQSMVNVADTALKKPTLVKVDYSNVYPDIVGYSFVQEEI